MKTSALILTDAEKAILQALRTTGLIHGGTAKQLQEHCKISAWEFDQAIKRLRRLGGVEIAGQIKHKYNPRRAHAIWRETEVT